MKESDLPEDVKILIKATYHLCAKAYPSNGRISVPVREFERVQAKSNKIQQQLERGE